MSAWYIVWWGVDGEGGPGLMAASSRCFPSHLESCPGLNSAAWGGCWRQASRERPLTDCVRQVKNSTQLQPSLRLVPTILQGGKAGWGLSSCWATSLPPGEERRASWSLRPWAGHLNMWVEQYTLQGDESLTETTGFSLSLLTFPKITTMVLCPVRGQG